MALGGAAWVAGCGVWVEAGMAGPKTASFVVERASVEGVEALTLGRMLPLVHRRFRISERAAGAVGGPGGGVELELMATVALPRHQAGVHEKFALVFKGGCERDLEQKLYGITFPGVGTVELLFTPIVAREGHGRQYEVVINRERPPEWVRHRGDGPGQRTISEKITTTI